MTARKKHNPQQDVDQFNAKFKVGDQVAYSEIIGEQSQTFTIAHPAEVLSGHTAVVWLHGKRGCVCVDHCRAA